MSKADAFEPRRHELSAWLDSTDPDLSRFAGRGGKLIVAIGTDDTLASPGAQLDYYQSVIDKMGRSRVDSFARFFVIPQVGHGLRGSNYSVDGEGKTIPVAPIPSAFDRVQLLIDWVEHGSVPGKSMTVTAGDRSMPMCSYPTYPKYVSGPPTAAARTRALTSERQPRVTLQRAHGDVEDPKKRRNEEIGMPAGRTAPRVGTRVHDLRVLPSILRFFAVSRRHVSA